MKKKIQSKQMKSRLEIVDLSDVRVLSFCQDILFQMHCICLFGSALCTTFTSQTLQLFALCFNRCMKRFLGKLSIIVYV